MLKDFRVIILIASVVISIGLLIPFGHSGVVVKSVLPDSPFAGKLVPGEYITWMNSKTIKDVDDFYAFNNFTGTMFFMHSGKKGIDSVAIEKEGLGVFVEEPSLTRLKLGMDLTGGTRVLLSVSENITQMDSAIEQTIATLQRRINIYGLKEAKITGVDSNDGRFIQIEIAGSYSEVEDLLSKQGRFEAKIPKIVELKNNTGTLKLGGKNYSVSVIEDEVSIDGVGKFGINDTFTLDGISFDVSNITNTTVIVSGLVFSSEDIKSVCMHDSPGVCRSFIQPVPDGFRFNFQVTVSREGAERFAALTKDMEIVLSGGRYVLKNGIINLYIDNKLLSTLSISSNLKGVAETQPSITGFERIKENAVNEKLKLQSILSSGALPVRLTVERVDQISPSLGREFLSSIFTAGFLAIFVVASVVFIRYRNLRIVIPMILTSISEILIILGIASLIGWTIDLAAVAAIIAVIGTGVDAQVMIVDEILLGRERVYTIKEKIKRAFFIIFSAAATLVAAMLPLMIIGFGMMRGFAITTLIGVFVGVFIARPAFTKIAEKILGK